MYTDKHLKSQLGIIIAGKFIKELVGYFKASDYDITFFGLNYVDYASGRQIDDRRRYLSNNLYDDVDRDSVLEEVMSWCPSSRCHINSLSSLTQHFRDLVITDTVTRKMLAILPDGGFQNGWYIDSAKAAGIFYGTQCGVDAKIPIINSSLLKFHIELE